MVDPATIIDTQNENNTEDYDPQDLQLRDELITRLTEKNDVDCLVEIGNLLREQKWRQIFAQRDDFTSLLVTLLTTTSPSASSEPLTFPSLIRIAANLIAENETNRNKLAASLPPHFFITNLQNTTLRDTHYHLCALLSNLTNWPGEYSVELVKEGILPILMRFTDDEIDDDITELAARTLSNMASPETREEYKSIFFLERLEHLAFESSHVGVRKEAIEAMEMLLNYDQPSLLKFIDRNGLENLLSLSEDHSNPTSSHSFNLLCDLLQSPSPSSERIREMFLERRILDRLMMNVVNPPSDLIVQNITLKLLGLLAINDRCMREVFKEFKVFVSLMYHDNKEIQLHALLILSNIARDQRNCELLVENGAVGGLMKLAGGVGGGVEADPRIQNLAITALRNLAIPPSLRDRVFSPEIFIILNHILRSSINAIILYNAILTFKVFLNDQKYLDVFEREGCLSAILLNFERTLQDGHERILYETARLCTRLLDLNEKYVEEIANNGGIKGFSSLLETSFSILHFESLRSFIRILNNLHHSPKRGNNNNDNNNANINGGDDGDYVWMNEILGAEISSKVLKILRPVIENVINDDDDNHSNDAPKPSDLLYSSLHFLHLLSEKNEKAKNEIKEKLQEQEGDQSSIYERLLYILKQPQVKLQKIPERVIAICKAMVALIIGYHIVVSGVEPKIALHKPISEYKIGEIKTIFLTFNVRDLSGCVEKSDLIDKLKTFCAN